VELYTIPFQGQTIIYKPRRHLTFIGNAALARYVCRRKDNVSGEVDEGVERFLQSVGFDGPELECRAMRLGETLPPLTGLVLLMTNRCNLRCIYCYANAGEESAVSEIDWPTAQVAMDFVLTNARQPEAEPPSITFHGGGEPTLHWELLVRAVEYAKERDCRTHFSMSSNGVWSDDQCRFICQHFSNVSLSMDGTAAVQNRQRPRAGGGETFPLVLEGIRAMDTAGIDYGIRMTVLENSVDSLPEGVQFICENTKAKAIQIEPTFTNRRGHYADIGEHFANVFSDRFMEAWRIGRNAGRSVYYSGARPWVIAPLFCLAPLKALVVTADGRLVTCFEMFSEQNMLADQFTVGRIRDGHVAYDRPALAAFLEEQQKRRQECVDCFCYWHCGGDCATRRPGRREASEGRCRATRNITLGLLLAYMEEGQGVWQGLREVYQEEGPGCESQLH
jgi:uncharacterized protein